VVNGFNNIKMGPSPMAHYYHAYKDSGIDAVIASYNDIKNNHADEFQIHPAQLYKFAYFLIDKEKLDDAIKMFEFNILENPELYYLYDGLAEAYLVKGEKDKAIKYYIKSLDIFPDNTNATKMLEIINKN
jgi:tetratricopeptide (TPR) repeat protein